ncbi:MAG: LytTR family transcriptional regulator DNA-binding domain-containing protein [Taibaiella sp.]|nr:LytTR family transcriptional regulator DNA-binding domain-containing protein [Taibaiella sp.]
MTNSFQYIIIDDEAKAIKMLSNAIGRLYDNLEMTGAYTDWEPALAALENGEADIAFVDISMPRKNGFSLLEMVPDLSCEVIFVTAHEEYALKAFKFSPVGYLLKPVNDARLKAAVDKAITHVQNKKLAAGHVNDAIISKNNKLGIRNNNGLDYINIDDIIYFEANARYTKVVIKGRSYLSSCNIGKFKKLVEGRNFYSVHRSFIVNTDRITRYVSTGVLVMEDGHEIPVSKNIREDFLNLFNRI